MLIRIVHAAILLAICGGAAAQQWQEYDRNPGQVLELDTSTLRVDGGKVFFAYRERWPNITVGRTVYTTLGVVDCAARQRSDVERDGSYTLRDIYAGTGQAAQADLACRLAGLAPSTDTVASTPMPNSVIRLIDPPQPRVNTWNSTSRPPLKVAFMYVGPVGDVGWTFAHDAGRRAVEAQLGGRVRLDWVEEVPEGAAAEPVIQRLIDEGNTLIFATAFGYQEPVIKAAQENPRVRFEQVSGYKTVRNVRTYDVREDEGAYLAGVLAGRMTRNNILGFVGSVAIPQVVRNVNAFTLGARSVNPRARVRVSWVGEWFNPPKESHAARELIAGGADVLMQNTDSPEVVATAQRLGKRAIGWDSDMARYGLRAHLASVVMNWGPYYVKAVRDALDGTWSGGRIRWGVREDAL